MKTKSNKLLQNQLEINKNNNLEIIHLLEELQGRITVHQIRKANRKILPKSYLILKEEIVQRNQTQIRKRARITI